MTSDNGIQIHPLFKLGKLKTVRDARTLRFRDVLRALLATPRQYDFDLAHRGIPIPVFANDRYHNSVMAARAHQTLRFELLEADKNSNISDQDVMQTYFAETGGGDVGLDPLMSLKAWCKKGWTAAGIHSFIRAFAEIDPRMHEQIRQAIYMELGVGMALELPLSAQAQVQAGRPWDVVTGGDSTGPGSWGGHYVPLCGYTVTGPVCVTWGRKQQMTWAFVDRYCDAVYAILGIKNNVKSAAVLDFQKLDKLLREASSQPARKS